MSMCTITRVNSTYAPGMGWFKLLNAPMVPSPHKRHHSCNHLYVLQLAIQASHNHTISMARANKLHPAVVLLLVDVLLLGNLDLPGHIPLVAGPPSPHTGQAGIV